MLKRLSVSHGPRSNLLHATVELNGISPSQKLTPKMARQAANIACGHTLQVTVWDNEYDYGYRLYQNSARKVR